MLSSSMLFILSIIESVVVLREIHKHYHQLIDERKIIIMLNDFIVKSNHKNVEKIVAEFLTAHPEFFNKKDTIYKNCYQILEHRETLWKKKLTQRLTRFIKPRKQMHENDVVSAFIKEYPVYKKQTDEIYPKIDKIKISFAINNEYTKRKEKKTRK